MRTPARRWALWLSIPLAAAAPAAQAGRDRPAADLILEGRVFTAEPNAPWAEALAVRGPRIVAVGTREEIARLRGDDTRVLSFAGRSIVPGFNDAHCHFTVAFGIDLGVDLTAAHDLAGILEIVRRYAAANADRRVITGGMWDLSDLPGEVYPTAAMLDAAVADRPVLLFGDGPHAVWANSAGLRAAGIDNETRDPKGGRIVRDPDTGEPTGVALGRGLTQLFKMPFPDVSGVRDDIVRGLAEARRLGITTIQEPVSPLLLPVLAELHDAGKLTARFNVWGGLSGTFGGPKATARFAKQFARAGWIEFGPLKGGVDGMPGLRTSALLEPYADDASTTGLVSSGSDELDPLVRAANEGGFAVALHATGDRAVRIALDAFAAAGATSELRNRVEHAFVVADADIARFARDGVVASMQPAFLATELAKGRYYERRFGAARASDVMPIRSLLDAGAVVAFGTDHSLTPLDPLIGLYAAVAREPLTRDERGAFVPDQRISLEQAVRAYTWGSAYAEAAEDRKGTLAPGKLADIVVLSADIFALDIHDLPDVRVLTTIVNGALE